jgi:short-subunit dehydrogenase
VNLISRIRQTKVVVEIAKRSKKKFQIILISSSTGLMPIPQFSVYSATTSGLLNFSRACQSERDSKDVKIVSAVMDGMDTNFQLKAGIDKRAQDLLNPDVVAKRLINLGESFSGAIYIGRKIQIIRIMNRILPVEWIDWLLSHASRRRFS